jgi:Ser/Thr protein kinase RdoA (MazF antagonist)
VSGAKAVDLPSLRHVDETAALEAWHTIVGTARLEPFPTVTNPIWQVHAENGTAYVLKRLPEYPPGAGPIDEFRVVGFLQARGVPVAPPIITDDGHIFTERNDRRYALLPSLPNDRGNHELGPHAATTAYNIGAAIGRIDEALAEFPWPVRSFEDDPAKDLPESMSKIPVEVSNLAAPFTNRLAEATADLPRQRTVGDCNEGNVLVHGTEVSGFIDLDHLPIGPRVRDLAYYLVSRLRNSVGSEPATAAFLAVLHRYIAGYHDAYPLTAHERAAVVPLLLVNELGLADWHLHSWTPRPDKFEENVRTIEWITAHFHELEAAARS